MKTERAVAGEKMLHIVVSSKDEVLCRDSCDYTTFENHICFAAYRSGCSLLAYAVMSNHIHVALVYTGRSHEIFLRALRLSYAMYFNRRYGRHGTVCKKYTYCTEVCGYPQQKTVISYILRNPLHHGICETPWQYRHSSISAYFNTAMTPANDTDDYTRNNCKEKDTGIKSIALREGTHYVRFPVDINGRILLDKAINAGRVEHIFRTARNFIHCMNRWKTEEWEKEQQTLNPSGGIFSLQDSEPGDIMPLDTMRAYENASFRPHVSDIKICRYIDRVLLPSMGIQSYAHLPRDCKPELVKLVRQKFHVSGEQAVRCIGGPV